MHYSNLIIGVGLDRVTENFRLARVDDGVCVSDQEVLDTAQWLLRNEGLFVGSSSALNIAAAARTAKSLLSGDAAPLGKRPKVSSCSNLVVCIYMNGCFTMHR